MTDTLSHRQKLIIRDIFAGTFAGITVTLVGHPFDTLKVRLQTQPTNPKLYKGLLDCFKKTLEWEGFRGLYKGVASPIAGQMAFRANMFLSFAEAKRYLSRNGTHTLTYKDYYLSGALAWASGTLFECPIDLFKSQLQVQIIKSKTIPSYIPPYTSLLSCASTLIRSYPYPGPFKGFVPHLCRNIPGGALHLGTFEIVRTELTKRRGVKREEATNSEILIAGGAGGWLFWFIMFPMDVVKSAIQTDSFDKRERKYTGMMDAIAKLYKEGGWKRFYAGFSPCLMRAIPANALMLLTTTWVTDKIHITPPSVTAKAVI